ncbi:uncharacterized protein LOC122665701 [Telopea speciosissima]|uniref:uncharacterized protein LOC122665701 n=1 Tax=Telopea speciosissima TaxID=54955 RepID=UPI001CC6C5A0|nr:uncharacterized protein LOC122665701 [Telopea speciosissima]
MERKKIKELTKQLEGFDLKALELQAQLDDQNSEFRKGNISLKDSEDNVYGLKTQQREFKELNKTFICVIPKVKAPESADNFRPISLCNIAFKIITKLIAERLNGALDQIISPVKSSFTPNRLISDNILVAHEMFHYIKKQKKGKDKFLALKLDMRKAYDRLEWNFIEGMLLKLGFRGSWVHLVITCITYVSYNLLVNGYVKGAISPSRGIKQGDPISPVIFILCSQALTIVIRQAELVGTIRGVRVRHRGEPVTHLLFTDGCLLFGRVDLQEINALSDCLDLYYNATGQAINFHKSNLTFSPNTHDRIKRWFSRILKVRHGDGLSKYLSLPNQFGVSKKEVFNDIKERTLNRLQGWKGKLLSHAGKEVLLKPAVAPMANFASSHFKLPSSFHEAVKKASARWIPSLQNFKLQTPKPDGYDILKVADLIDPVSQRWNLNLIQSLFHPTDAAAIINIPLSIYPGEDKKIWGVSKDGQFSVKSAYRLLARKEEENVWSKASTSRSRQREHIPDVVWNRIWAIQTLPKIKLFLWRTCNEALAIGAGLISQHVNIDPSCSTCGVSPESEDHILFDCPFACNVWFGSPLQFSPLDDMPNLVDWIQGWDFWFKKDKRIAQESLSRASFICWYLRQARNDFVFNGKDWTPSEVILVAEKAFLEFFAANQRPGDLSGFS